jgi:hypothetical protein
VAPTAPTEAASVGVAMPPSMEPSTATISAIGGTSARATCPVVRPALSDAGIAGPTSGRNQVSASWYAM